MEPGQVANWLDLLSRLWFQVAWRWRWLSVEVSPMKQFPAYSMMQLWVRNESNLEAESVRASMTWRRVDGAASQSLSGQGYWTHKQATGLAGYTKVSEGIDLSTNREPQHLAFLVREPGGAKVYVATTGSYRAANWQHPNWLIPPGSYEVDVQFDAMKRRRMKVTLNVTVHADGHVGAEVR
jgi:hypothetical protein